MITLLSLLFFLGFFQLYASSERMPHNQQMLGITWVQQHKLTAKAAGSSLVVLSLLSTGIQYGWGAGLLLGSIMLMTIGSLTICITPLRVIGRWGLLALFSISFSLELLIF
ncbi:hypothetical protein Q4603_19365 [Zobellia galactanivorans]|uniref:hypothetical protein n=1 Tax=Zobellia TaxID=112040 RepID=UPI000B52B4A1|nr:MULTISPECIES: hypothetical protein [Zobellia]MBU3027893.1 hypothetical protein [Zobellia galactanivorans]MDO6810789.1 hypothetical protein [Zobellia galactanivorans]OWW25079.1 hypothetical protein B4Q04_11070 [Zobellia sp. OII3]